MDVVDRESAQFNNLKVLPRDDSMIPYWDPNRPSKSGRKNKKAKKNNPPLPPPHPDHYAYFSNRPAEGSQEEMDYFLAVKHWYNLTAPEVPGFVVQMQSYISCVDTLEWFRLRGYAIPPSSPADLPLTLTPPSTPAPYPPPLPDSFPPITEARSRALWGTRDQLE